MLAWVTNISVHRAFIKEQTLFEMAFNWLEESLLYYGRPLYKGGSNSEVYLSCHHLVDWRGVSNKNYIMMASIIKWKHFPRYLWGEPSVTGGFPSQRPVTRSFDVFFDLRVNKRLSKQWRCQWFETTSRSLWRHSNYWIWSATTVRKLTHQEQRTQRVVDLSTPLEYFFV